VYCDGRHCRIAVRTRTGAAVYAGSAKTVIPLSSALVSIGKHVGMFVDRVQIQERKQISAEPMSAEEWKRQYVKEG